MRILVVDDDKSIRDFLKSSLEAECFVVDAASDGNKGARLALSNAYDLIILDNVMPKKKGLEVCQELRDEGIEIPIIILSVKSETTTKVSLLDAGADDYLHKPFSFQELLARINALLRRPKRIEQTILEKGELTIDAGKHAVFCRGEEVRLTRKEFILLEYLMRNRGTVLTRGMIMEHVWDMNADPFSNTIDSHISSLRKKIRCSDEKSIIETVQGRGYLIA